MRVGFVIALVIKLSDLHDTYCKQAKIHYRPFSNIEFEKLIKLFKQATKINPQNRNTFILNEIYKIVPYMVYPIILDLSGPPTTWKIR